MIATEPQAHEQPEAPAFAWKLWIYTNYDCNLRCQYCVARSSPNAPRRAIGLANVQHLIDESTQLGFVHAFFTGGEPFLLPDIYDMLAYSSARMQTTVLTNAMELGENNRFRFTIEPLLVVLLALFVHRVAARLRGLAAGNGRRPAGDPLEVG